MRKIFILLATIALIATGCSEEDEPKFDIITLNETSKTLYFGDEYQIEAQSNSTIQYLSENKYHAVVSETGLVKAAFVGETNILLSNGDDNKTVKIVVKPQYNTYPIPDLSFGALRSTIISKLGTPSKTTEDAISYSDYATKAPIVMYHFDKDNKLIDVAVMVKFEYFSELAAFLSERYFCASVDDLVFFNGVTTESATFSITADLYNLSYWMVVYTSI